MKGPVFYILILFILNSYAQTPLPHGMVFGKKPDTTIIVDATKTMVLMGKKIRVSTTIRGKVVDVTKQKGGWFELDAGQGKIISAHFKNYGVLLPFALKGRVAIVEGIAVKQINAAEGQQINGGRVTAKDNPPKSRIVLGFEVTGLMVYK
jgi:hypothetical protein